ncbi:MAG: hypothetical protein LBR06_01770 [Bacteroidales bacterium]|jgi:hypothetical protein|nr:hypothetical protein [Bacteroidales bacterium]
MKKLCTIILLLSALLLGGCQKDLTVDPGLEETGLATVFLKLDIEESHTIGTKADESFSDATNLRMNVLVFREEVAASNNFTFIDIQQVQVVGTNRYILLEPTTKRVKLLVVAWSQQAAATGIPNVNNWTRSTAPATNNTIPSITKTTFAGSTFEQVVDGLFDTQRLRAGGAGNVNITDFRFMPRTAEYLLNSVVSGVTVGTSTNALKMSTPMAKITVHIDAGVSAGCYPSGWGWSAANVKNVTQWYNRQSLPQAGTGTAHSEKVVYTNAALTDVAMTANDVSTYVNEAPASFGTRVILKMKYEGHTASGDPFYYYPVGIRDSNAVDLPIRRNYQYIVNVKSVKSPGYTTLTDAIAAPPLNAIEYDIIPVDPNGLGYDVLDNGSNYIAVENTEVLLYCTDALSNYPLSVVINNFASSPVNAVQLSTPMSYSGGTGTAAAGHFTIKDHNTNTAISALTLNGINSLGIDMAALTSDSVIATVTLKLGNLQKVITIKHFATLDPVDQLLRPSTSNWYNAAWVCYNTNYERTSLSGIADVTDQPYVVVDLAGTNSSDVEYNKYNEVNTYSSYEHFLSMRDGQPKPLIISVLGHVHRFGADPNTDHHKANYRDQDIYFGTADIGRTHLYYRQSVIRYGGSSPTATRQDFDMINVDDFYGYVGAFWNDTQTGERLLTIPALGYSDPTPAAIQGKWAAVVIRNLSADFQPGQLDISGERLPVEQNPTNIYIRRAHPSFPANVYTNNYTISTITSGDPEAYPQTWSWNGRSYASDNPRSGIANDMHTHKFGYTEESSDFNLAWSGLHNYNMEGISGFKNSDAEKWDCQIAQGGTCTSSTPIRLRIGIQNSLTEGGIQRPVRYGLIALFYNNYTKYHLIWLRQGADADWVMRNSADVSDVDGYSWGSNRTAAAKVSPYNLTHATQYTPANDSIGQQAAALSWPNGTENFVPYPTIGGCYYYQSDIATWSGNTNTYLEGRYSTRIYQPHAFHPVQPAYTAWTDIYTTTNPLTPYPGWNVEWVLASTLTNAAVKTLNMGTSDISDTTVPAGETYHQYGKPVFWSLQQGLVSNATFPVSGTFSESYAWTNRHTNYPDLCPQGYYTPSDGSTSEAVNPYVATTITAASIITQRNASIMRSSLVANDATTDYDLTNTASTQAQFSSSTNVNHSWGYYADGFFDRRGVSDHATNGSWPSSYTGMFAKFARVTSTDAGYANWHIGYVGAVVYNPNNPDCLPQVYDGFSCNKYSTWRSVFMPAAGRRTPNMDTSGANRYGAGTLERVGKYMYYTTTSVKNPVNDVNHNQNGHVWLLSYQKRLTQYRGYGVLSGNSIRCFKNP